MDWPVIILGVIVLSFGFVVAFGAPYLPTLNRQTELALDLLNLKKGQTLLELGSGDGRVLKAAAKRGLFAIGYELNPILVLVSKIMTWKYRRNIKIIWGDYWKVQWPKPDGIFVFLLDKYMAKLDKKIVQQQLKVPLVSFAFKIPGKQILKQTSGLFLYKY